MKRSKMPALIVGLVSGALALSACGGGSGESGGGDTWIDATVANGKIDLKGQPCVSLITSFNNDYYQGWDRGAQEAAKQLNCAYTKLTNEGDQALELSQLQQQIGRGVKIFFNTAPDPAVMPAMAKLATESKVCLAETWENPEWTSPFDYGDGYTLYSTPNNEEIAYELAKKLFDEMGGEGNFVHLTGHPGGTPDYQRTRGVDRALAEHPQIKMIDRQPGEWNRDDARKAMAGIIAKHGSDIDGVFGQNDDVGIGALNALKEAKISDVPVTGIDGNQGTMELIKAGEMFASVSVLPFWQSGFSLVQAVDRCLGTDSSPLNRQVFTAGVTVTKENVDQYLETFYGDTLPFDYNLMSRVANPDTWDPQNGVTALDMDFAWAFAKKPDGFRYPPAYEENKGDFAAVNKEWADHWKKKYLE